MGDFGWFEDAPKVTGLDSAAAWMMRKARGNGTHQKISIDVLPEGRIDVIVRSASETDVAEFQRFSWILDENGGIRRT